jgi:hypothetical protein
MATRSASYNRTKGRFAAESASGTADRHHHRTVAVFTRAAIHAVVVVVVVATAMKTTNAMKAMKAPKAMKAMNAVKKKPAHASHS